MRLALRELAAREVVSVLCEGAPSSRQSIGSRLPDELHAFIAPILLGPRGRPGAVDWAGPRILRTRRGSRRLAGLCGNDAYVSGVLVYPKRAGSRLRADFGVACTASIAAARAGCYVVTDHDPTDSRLPRPPSA